MGKLRDSKPADFASEYDPMQVSAHKDACLCSSVMRRAVTIRS
jgi:hypothetical protein